MLIGALDVPRLPWDPYTQTRTPTPKTIFGASAVRAWYDRRFGVLAGTPPDVATWSDQSSFGNHETQAIELSRPHEAADGLDFDGVLSYLAAPDSASLDATTTLIVAYAITPDVVTGNHSIVSKSATGAGEWSTQTNGAAVRFFLGAPAVSWGEGGTLVAGTPTRLIHGYDGTATGDAARLRLWQDGAAQSLTFVGLPIPATITPGASPLTIGAFSNPLQFFDGRIRAVVIMIGVVPTAAQIAALDAYLARV